ncbi:MAG TPA: ribosome small subunit-dependent GTPase A, partial [Acidothermaceae bacterium]
MSLLHTLGFDDARARELDALISSFGKALVPARVSRVDRGALTVLTDCETADDTGAGTLRVRLAGSFMHARRSNSADQLGKPAVGDWVALDGGTVVAVFDRRSMFARLGTSGEAVAQAVAANIDIVFVVVPLTGRWRPRLVQRCLALAWQSGATPVVLLTKVDLARAGDTEGDDSGGADDGGADDGPDDVDERIDAARAEAVGVEVHAISSTTGEGLDALEPYLTPGQTVVMIGPSGSGKSTLTNALGAGKGPSVGRAGLVTQQTGAVRDDGKGRHTTTARELIVLPSGAIVIDTPGLRGVGLWDADDGIALGFADVAELAADCRFSDCAHHGEPGCAVLRAISEG